MVEEIKFLKRKDEDYIYGATPALLKHDDLHACDKDGNLLYGVASAPEAVGLRPAIARPAISEDAIIKEHAKKISENVAQALGVPIDVAVKIMNGEVHGKSKATEPETQDPDDEEIKAEPTTETGGLLKNKTRAQLCSYAIERFGEAAAHLEPEMPKPAIIEEIERLEFETENDE